MEREMAALKDQIVSVRDGRSHIAAAPAVTHTNPHGVKFRDQATLCGKTGSATNVHRLSIRRGEFCPECLAVEEGQR
jgi:hypothetical protein